MAYLQLAALCCLYMAYLTAAEKLPASRGYNYQPPATPFPSPPKRPQPRPQTSYIPPNVQSAYIPPSPSHVRPTFPQEAPTQSQFQAPTYSRPRPSYNAPPQAAEKPMPFDYGYGVNDALNGIDFGHSTNSDGRVTTGEYRVLLPDGRTQIVSYKVDDNNGYRADVTYEGEARPYEPPRQSYQPPQQSFSAPQGTYGFPSPQVPQSNYIPPKTVKTPDTLYRADF